MIVQRLVMLVVLVWRTTGSSAAPPDLNNNATLENARQIQLLSEALVTSFKQIADEISQAVPLCQPPYTRVLDQCYYIHQLSPVLGWEDARAFCKNAGGDLAQPKHFGALVAHLFSTTDLTRTLFNVHTYEMWVGGKAQADGTLKWLSGAIVQQAQVENGAEEVGHTPAEDQRCLSISMSNREVPSIIPGICNKKIHYICELGV